MSIATTLKDSRHRLQNQRRYNPLNLLLHEAAREDDRIKHDRIKHVMHILNVMGKFEHEATGLQAARMVLQPMVSNTDSSLYSDWQLRHFYSLSSSTASNLVATEYRYDGNRLVKNTVSNKTVNLFYGKPYTPARVTPAMERGKAMEGEMVDILNSMVETVAATGAERYE